MKQVKLFNIFRYPMGQKTFAGQVPAVSREQAIQFYESWSLKKGEGRHHVDVEFVRVAPEYMRTHTTDVYLYTTTLQKLRKQIDRLIQEHGADAEFKAEIGYGSWGYESPTMEHTVKSLRPIHLEELKREARARLTQGVRSQ